MSKINTLKGLLKRSHKTQLFFSNKQSYSRKLVWFGYAGTGVGIGSLFLSGSVFKWCSCQGAINDVENDGSYWRKSLHDFYQEKLVNSSVLRFGRAAVTVVSVFADYKYTLSGVDHESNEYKQRKSDCHLRCAIRFRDLCSANGGVFMKVGQHIGSLDFLFPKEYTDTLKCFQYSAPESPIGDIQYVIETDTLKSMDELFSTFDEKPVGSASLAQVHVATLKSGEKVAVKVQHKAVKIHAFQDAKVIEFFANIAGQLFPEFQFQWLVDQIKANVPLELNFINEGHNCEKMGKYLEKFDNIMVPKIFWEKSTQRVLFMEYIEGGAVDDIEYIKKNKLNVNQISKELGKLYSEMIFVNGNVHCDPHAGNILIRNKKNIVGNGVEVVLLDHGLYVQMKDVVRLNYCKLWQSLIQRDIEGIKKYSDALGVGEYYGLFACMVSGRSWNSIQNGISQKSLSKDELDEIQTGAMNFISEITKVFEKIPRELVLVFKTNDLLRGLDARLKTSAASASFITMSKSCLRAVYEEDIAKCENVASKWKLYTKFKWNQLCIVLYQLSLSSPIGFSLPSKISFSDAANGLVNGLIGLFNIVNSIHGLFARSVS